MELAAKTAFGRNWIERVEQAPTVRAVRNGLVHMIPVLIIGAFALILQQFPIAAYKAFLAENEVGQIIRLFLEIVNKATFGVLSLHMTFSVSRAYMTLRADPDTVKGGGILTSLVSFFVLAGAYSPEFSLDSMGPKSMFLALLTGLGASAVYLWLSRRFRKYSRTLFSAGADREFNRMLAALFPIAVTVGLVTVLDVAVIRVFDVESFRQLLSGWFSALFRIGDNGFLKGLFFVLFSSVLWFFGIHGSDVLEGVMQEYFAPVASSTAVHSIDPILHKEFFDCFVLMGGCGATICLLVALLIFSRNRARRGLALSAAFPMVFNINEMMVFGLPIIFNPVMLIPFLIVPLFCYTSSYVAIASGLVPVIENSVEWTTPILLGGYTATGSFAGAALQLFNLIVGVLIYMPFVHLLDRSAENESKRQFEVFMGYFKAHEADPALRFTALSNVNGDFAKGICADLRHSVRKGEIVMAYQPQYSHDGVCIGVEALLRYRHPLHGVLYPPMVIRLAEEGGFLTELEEAVIRQVLADRDRVLRRFGEGVKLSFNVTGATIVSEPFLRFLRQLNAEEPFAGKNLCIEITEQTVLTFTEQTDAALSELRRMGFALAIDDFSMGQTSIHYLKDNFFDWIKLDGSLVKGLSTHKNTREIVSSIVGLAATLNMTVLAEFVETEEEKETLHAIGCDCYQGWLYSPAVFLDK